MRNVDSARDGDAGVPACGICDETGTPGVCGLGGGGGAGMDTLPAGALVPEVPAGGTGAIGGMAGVVNGLAGPCGGVCPETGPVPCPAVCGGTCPGETGGKCGNVAREGRGGFGDAIPAGDAIEGGLIDGGLSGCVGGNAGCAPPKDDDAGGVIGCEGPAPGGTTPCVFFIPGGGGGGASTVV